MTKAIIIAGGKGTRLAPITDHMPKVLVPIDTKPLIQHQVEFLRGHGIKEIWLLLGHLGDQVERFLEEKDWGIVFHFKHEEKPLGTAGALKQLEGEIQEDMLVLSGDVMVNFDVQRFSEWHAQRKGIISLMAHPNNHPFDSDLVETSTEGEVSAILRRPHPRDIVFRNLSIASVYVFSPRIFAYLPKGEKSDIEKDIVPKLLEAKETLYAYNTPEYIKDMGTPERLQEVRKDYKSGKIERMSLEYERRAVFLDRDGVLVEQVDQLSRPEDLKLYEFSQQALRKINESDYMAILVSNQPMIAKGFLTEKGAEDIQKKLETELGRKGAKLDASYYCPHHPEKGFEGERSELKIDCECRKPEPGLLLRAQRDFHINLQESYMIGDQTADMVAGERAGCKTVLVKTGYAGRDGKYEMQPDITARTLLEAVEMITLPETPV